MRVQCLGFRVQGLVFRVQGSGFAVKGSGSRAWGLGSRVQVLEFGSQGAGFTRPQGIAGAVMNSWFQIWGT